MDHISPHRWQKTRETLSTQGFSREHRDELESVLAGEIDERTGELRREDSEGNPHTFKGRGKDEINERFEWMEKNPDKHDIPQHKLEDLKNKLL